MFNHQELFMLRVSIVLAGWMLAVSAQAHTIFEANLICPIGGEKFKSWLSGSGTSFGKFLDLKPYGPIAAPWPLAKCPSNGFVMFKREFSKEEIQRLTPFVESAQYQELKKTHTNYYLAALLQRQVQATPKQVASTLLQATWEASDERYPVYAREALEAYVALLKTEPSDSKDWLTYQLLAGELERRLKMFGAAISRFSALDTVGGIDPYVREIVELQLSLIRGGNSGPQRMPAGKK